MSLATPQLTSKLIIDWSCLSLPPTFDAIIDVRSFGTLHRTWALATLQYRTAGSFAPTSRSVDCHFAHHTAHQTHQRSHSTRSLPPAPFIIRRPSSNPLRHPPTKLPLKGGPLLNRAFPHFAPQKLVHKPHENWKFIKIQTVRVEFFIRSFDKTYCNWVKNSCSIRSEKIRSSFSKTSNFTHCDNGHGCEIWNETFWTICQ